MTAQDGAASARGWQEGLTDLGVDTRELFQDLAFARNRGIIDIGEQDRLGEALVCLPGLGGVGGLHLVALARLGVRRFRLAEPDSFELVNFNRQYGASLETLGMPKLEVMEDAAASINPWFEVERYPHGLDEANLETFLAGADLVLDGLDFFELPIRREMFNRARDMGIPVVTAGPLGLGSALLLFTPEGMSFDRYFDIKPGQSPEEQFLRFGMGLAPKGLHLGYMDMTRINLSSRQGPSSFIACLLCSSMASMEAARLLLGRPGVRPAPCFLQFDPFLRRMRRGRLRWGNRGPLQRLRLFIASRFLLEQEPPARHEHPPRPEAGDEGEPGPHVLDYVMKAGRAAPSGDNAQPWKFEPGCLGLTVHLDSSADESFFNVRQVASLISCGAVLENMHLAARDLGFASRVEAVSSFAGRGPVGRLEVTGRREAGEPLADAVWSRTTNRRMYSRRPVADGVRLRLERELERIGGVRLHWVQGARDLSRLARVVAAADTIRTEHRGLHEHFMSMVRFTDEEASRTRDGLPLGNLYAGRAGEVFLRITRSWKVMRLANRLGASRMLARHSARGIVSSGAAALVTASGRSWDDFLRGGRGLERCWLRLTLLGLAMQPMTAVTLFRLRWVMEGEASFSQEHRDRLKRIWPVYENLFPQVDFGSEGEVMLFRMGHARPVTRGTLRRGLDSLRI